MEHPLLPLPERTCLPLGSAAASAAPVGALADRIGRILNAERSMGRLGIAFRGHSYHSCAYAQSTFSYQPFTPPLTLNHKPLTFDLGLNPKPELDGQKATKLTKLERVGESGSNFSLPPR